MNGGMSAFGPKQTWACALQESAFGGKADILLAANRAVNYGDQGDRIKPYLL